MDALEFLKTAKRRCENGEKVIYSVIDLEKIDIEKYVKNVEEWNKNNPIKTRQTELIKMFPNVPIRCDGYVDIAPCNLDEEIDRKCSERGPMKCDECYKEFWGKEVE